MRAGTIGEKFDSDRDSERAGLGVDDAARAAKALKGIKGKRLTYRRIDEAANG